MDKIQTFSEAHPKYCLISHTEDKAGTLSHTQIFNGPFPGLPGWTGTRKVKPILILLKQETVSGSGISWATMQVCTSDALPAAQPRLLHCDLPFWRQPQSNLDIGVDRTDYNIFDFNQAVTPSNAASLDNSNAISASVT